MITINYFVHLIIRSPYLFRQRKEGSILCRKRKWLIQITFILITFDVSNGSDFCETYHQEVHNSIRYYKDNYKLLNSIIEGRFKLNSEFAYSIVAPEVGFYLKTMDEAETRIVEIFYIQLGKDYANLSIGNFQMKAKFVEYIENYIKKHKYFKKYKELIRYDSKDELAVRKERVKRIKSPEWVINYLCLFCIVSEYKYKKYIRKLNCQEKLIFLSTAYNCGLESSYRQIKNFMNWKGFPGAGAYLRYSYSSASICIYNQLMGKYYEK